MDDEKKAALTKSAVLAVSLFIHGVVLYLAFNWKIDVRIIDFKHDRTDVVLIPPTKIKFTAGAQTEPLRPPGQAEEFPAARAGQSPSGGGRQAGGGSGGAAPSGRIPLIIGGIPGEVLTTEERDRKRELTSGFSLVYPADALLNLSKYGGRIPEEDLLQPFRESIRPAPDLSRYVRPPAGKPSTSISQGFGGGGTGEGGGVVGIGTIKPPPAGVVAAFIPDDVKTFDLSGWASEVLNAVQRHWSMGTTPGSPEWSGRATLSVLVMASGELNTVEMAASSGFEPLDAAARRAVEKSGPWPVLPEGFPGTSLQLQLVFKYGK